jgi:hypothetical protein
MAKPPSSSNLKHGFELTSVIAGAFCFRGADLMPQLAPAGE